MISYRFDPDYAIAGRHYAHPLIQWPAIVAGTIAAIAIGFVLNVLGLAVGASAFNPFAMEQQDQAITIGGGLYVMFAQLVALQIGAYIAARASQYPDHFGGLLTGFMVWALAVFVAVVLATWAASAATSSDALASGVASTVGELSDASDGQAASAGELATADDSAEAVAALSWWTTGALLLGLAGAIAGGWLGAAHPTWETRPRLADDMPYQHSPKL